jgi:hypothetical protein
MKIELFFFQYSKMNDILSIIYPGLKLSFCIKKHTNLGLGVVNKIFEKVIKFNDIKGAQWIIGKLDRDEILLHAINYGRYKFVKYILETISSNIDQSLVEIAMNRKRKRISKLLYTKIGTIYNYDDILRSSAQNANFYIFSKTYQRLDVEHFITSDRNYFILSWAVAGNNISIVDLILKNIKNGECFNMGGIMKKAGKIGNINIIRLLLKRKDCMMYINTTIENAMECGHYFIVKEFIKFCYNPNTYSFPNAFSNENLHIIKLCVENIKIFDEYDRKVVLDSIPVIEYLLSNPKTSRIVDKESAFIAATKHKNQKILDLLKN